ncbi:MAG TPA: Do family serine endopeptidase [Verrucomicrobiae bacterium]|nr:Do family serine endopeptidase [Verrucomicrobiae bacterium]
MRKAGAIIGSVCTLAALVLIMSEWLGTGPLHAGAAPQPQVKFEKTPLPKDVLARTSFAPVVKKVAPSVVTVYSTKSAKESIRSSPLFDDPFFRRFFGFGDGEGDDEDQPTPPRGGGRRRGGRMPQEQSLGSGVIVTSDGYILSNSHVVEGADVVKVSLGEGRADLVAKVVGSDPPTDISVLKVDAKDLTPVTITDSANLQVGDVVLAVGNPFGVGQTVTMGIVSAVGRGGFGIVDYEDFIQTDASINPGNSGGALVDVEGRLVGVNTAIISGTGGNMGIGFAVPINMARVVMDRIIKEGRVVRGYLGVMIQPITPELAEQFKLPNQSGALVGNVEEKSPAAAAGIENGDVISEFDGQKVNDSRHLRLMVSQTPPKTKVKLKILRQDPNKNRIVEVPVTATLGELPTERLASARGGRNRETAPSREEVLEGVAVTDLDNRSRKQFQIPDNIRGALVIEVAPDSTAYEAGIRPGDVIQEINRQRIRDAQSAVDLSKKLKTGRVLLRVWSKGGSRYLVVEPSEKK